MGLFEQIRHIFKLSRQSELSQTVQRYLPPDEPIEAIAEMLDPQIWKQPRKTVMHMWVNYHNKIEHKPVFGTGDHAVRRPPDYRDIANDLLREGRALTREEKKRYGINVQAKTCVSTLDHFTIEGLSNCIAEAKILALSISSVSIHTAKVKTWTSYGVKWVEFLPAPDGCPICMSLAGDYKIDEVPIPILKTHLGCRCSFSPAAREVD